MKITRPYLLLALLVIGPWLQAQDLPSRHGFGISQGFYDFNVRLLDGDLFAFDSAMSHTIRLGYQNRLTPTWELHTGFSNGFNLNQEYNDKYIAKSYVASLDLGIMYRLDNGRILRQDARLAPFLMFAYRVDHVSKLRQEGISPWLTYNQYSTGLRVRLGQRSNVLLHVGMDQKMGGDFNTLMHYRIGFTQNLGKAKSGYDPPKEHYEPIPEDAVTIETIEQIQDSLGEIITAKDDEIVILKDSLTKTSDQLIAKDQYAKRLEDSLRTCAKTDTIRIPGSDPVVLDAPKQDPKNDPKANPGSGKDLKPIYIPSDSLGMNFYIIAASTKRKREAMDLQEILQLHFEDVRVLKQESGYYRIGIMAGTDLDFAIEIMKDVIRLGYEPVWISKE